MNNTYDLWSDPDPTRGLIFMGITFVFTFFTALIAIYLTAEEFEEPE